MNANPPQFGLYRRAVARAHALAEIWQGDQESITKDQAASQLMEVLELHGWTQTAAPTERHLAVVDNCFDRNGDLT
jgi:predicted nucleic acid-binding protein